MLEKALKYLVSLGEAKEHIVNGITYSDKELIPIYNEKAQPLVLSTLTSLVAYIKNGTDEITAEGAVIVCIKNHAVVEVASQFEDASMQRHNFIRAVAEVPSIEFGMFCDADSFNIALQSKFIQTDDRDIILKVVGNLKDSAVKTIGDDGVSQSVTTKTGIATVADVKVPNPVSLKPYRTFMEIDQPESKFVFRMRDGGRCALYEADGGAWKNIARENICGYLFDELSELVSNGKVIILA